MTFKVFSPALHVALPPFSISVVPTSTLIVVCSASVAVAVTLSESFVVVAVYALTPLAKVGVNATDPIDSPERVVTNLPSGLHYLPPVLCR